MEEKPRKKLKIVEPAIVSLLVWVLYVVLVPAIVHPPGLVRDRSTTALINQLEDATQAYQLDHGVYPRGDGIGSRELAKALADSGPKRQKYFEVQSDMLSGGSFLNPSQLEAGVFHYRCPGLHNPKRFDLWAEDSRGDPFGINNWSR